MTFPKLIPLDGWRIWMAMLLLTLLLFGNTLPHGYNMDDELVTNGHRFTSKGLAGASDILNSPYYSDDMGYSYEYRPITHLSFALEHQLFGENPTVSHFLNLFIYALSAGCLFFFIRGLFPFAGLVFPWLTTLIFIAHPLHTEVVASIKNREELLSLLGGLLAALALIKHINSGKFLWIVVMIAALVTGLLAKLSVVSFTLLLPIIAIYKSVSNKTFASVVLLCTLVLAATVLYRTEILFPLLPVAVCGLIITSYGLRIIYNAKLDDSFAQGFQKHLHNVSNNLVHPGMSWMRKDKLNVASIVLLLIAISMAVYGEVTQLKWVTYISTVLLLVHPLLLLRFQLVIAICGVLIVVFSLMNFDERDVEPILYLALLNLGMFRLSGALKLKELAILQLTMAVALVVNSFLNKWELYFFLPTIIVLSIIHIPFLFSDDTKFRKYSYAVAGFLFLFFLIELFFEFNPSYATLLAIAVYLILISFSPLSKHAKPLIIALFFLPLIPNTLLIAEQIYNPKTVEVPTELVNLAPQNLRKSSIQKNNIDRPLNFAEYPLGFDASLEEKIATISTVVVHYIRLTIIPYPQAFYYGFSYFSKVNLAKGTALAALVVISTLIIIAFYFTFLQSPVGLSLWIFILSILVFSNILEPVAGMAGDRLAYVSSVGFCMALGYLLTKLYNAQKASAPKKAIILVIAAMLISYSGITIARNLNWKDALTLMRHDIENIPNSSQGHMVLASNLMKSSFEPQYTKESNQMQREALEHFKKSAAIDPNYLNVWFDMGRTYRILGEPKLALSCFQQTHVLDSTFYQATFNVATIAEELRDTATAITYYNRCIQFNPGMLEAYTNLSYLYFRLGRFEKSIAVNQKAIAYNPTWLEPYDNIAKVYSALNQPEKAAPFIKKFQELR